jgi:hypothetical protein
MIRTTWGTNYEGRNDGIASEARSVRAETGGSASPIRAPMTVNKRQKWREDMAEELVKLLARDEDEEHKLLEIVLKLPADDLNVLLGRIKTRLREEAEIGESLGAAGSKS